MDRNDLESALDPLIVAHGRMVRAAIDASACGTSSDFARARQARDEYADARDAFLDQVSATPAPEPPPPPPVPAVVAHEEQVRGRTRGRPLRWSRWIEITVAFRSVVYVYTAGAGNLIADGAPDDIAGASFQPLDRGHWIRFRGLEYRADDDGPAEVVAVALRACREVALRLHAAGLNDGAMRGEWPAGLPAFTDIVAGRNPGAAAA
ncbi:MAG: hypothetical protein U0359_30585 [Byssovorax sp.]